MLMMMMMLMMRLDFIPEDLSLITSKRRKNQEDFNPWVLKIFSNVIFWTKIDVIQAWDFKNSASSGGIGHQTLTSLLQCSKTLFGQLDHL